MKETLLWK